MKKLLLLLALCITATASYAQSSGLGNVLDRYYAVKIALTRDNFDSAKLASAQFATALGTSNLMTNATKKEVSKKLLLSAKKMQSAHDIEALRMAFRNASLDMISLVSKYHATGEPAAYVQFCSMQKAYWLSAERDVRNPYYGRKMLFCGELKKTIE